MKFANDVGGSPVGFHSFPLPLGYVFSKMYAAPDVFMPVPVGPEAMFHTGSENDPIVPGACPVFKLIVAPAAVRLSATATHASIRIVYFLRANMLTHQCAVPAIPGSFLSNAPSDILPLAMNRRAFLASLAAAVNAKEKSWEGIFVIMQTPFLDNFEIDEASLRRECDFLVRGRVHGMVWPAGAGESVSLSPAERRQHSQTVVKEVNGRLPVLIGVHGANKYEAMDYAKYAERIGADGLHALGPTSGVTDGEILTDYFTSIASVSKLPMCVQVTNGGMTTDLLLKLADKIPTLRILKLENSDVPHDVTRVMRERKRPVIASTGGGAMYLYNEMERGSGGTMAGAGLADIQAEIWDLFQAGKKQESRDLFFKFLPSAVLERRTSYILMKEILRRRGVFTTTKMRNTSRNFMDAGDHKELDLILETLKPHYRV